MVSVDLDQNIPLMEEYDPVTWSILVVRSPSSLDFLEIILSSDEAILEVITIWLHPPKDIFCGATRSMIGLNPPKYRSILCIFLDIIRYICKHAYRFRLSLYEDAFEPFVTQTYHRVEPIGNWWVSPSYLYFPPFRQKNLPNMGDPSQHPISILVPMLSYYHRIGSPISPIVTWSLTLHTYLPYSYGHFLMGSLFHHRSTHNTASDSQLMEGT